jgi:hypothetical protein
MALDGMFRATTTTDLTSVIGLPISAFSQDIPSGFRYMVADIGKPTALRDEFYG